MSRLCATPFLKENMSVAMVGYRTYPTADVAGQVDDLERALQYLRVQYPHYHDATLIGHSSGAHIAALGLLNKRMVAAVDRFIGLSGVYDIPSHYKFEAGRGVDRISPLAPACGGKLHAWKQTSPTRIIQKVSPQVLEQLPPILVCHGAVDTTVPYTSSIEFVETLCSSNPSPQSKISLQVFPDVEHSETVLQLMFGGDVQDQIVVWIRLNSGSSKEVSSSRLSK